MWNTIIVLINHSKYLSASLSYMNLDCSEKIKVQFFCQQEFKVGFFSGLTQVKTQGFNHMGF